MRRNYFPDGEPADAEESSSLWQEYLDEEREFLLEETDIVDSIIAGQLFNGQPWDSSFHIAQS